MRTGIGLVIIALGLGAWHLEAAQSRNSENSLTCEVRDWHDGDHKTVAEPRHQVIAQADIDRISASPNGSVTIHGTNRNDVEVKACVYASAPTEDEARQLASAVKELRGAGDIQPDGPKGDHDRHWSVSYEIWLPEHSSVDVSSVNGSVRVDHVDGKVKASTVNGGLHLGALAGDVRASTVNGGVRVELAGNTWQGSGLEVSTTNGGIHFAIPDNYAANVSAATVNGGLHCDFPVTIQGEIKKQMSFQLGAGGPEIKTSTVNGGIRFSRGA